MASRKAPIKKAAPQKKKKIVRKIIRKKPTVIREDGTEVTVQQQPKTSFWSGLMREDDPRSSRRVVTLVIAMLFIATCVTVLILLIDTFGASTRTSNINLKALEIQADLLQKIIYYQFMIVISGLAFITAPQFAHVLAGSLSGIFRRKTVTEDPKGGTTEETEEFFDEETVANGETTTKIKTKTPPTIE